MEEVCIECGGYGFPDKDCPSCGKSNRKIIDETTVKNVEGFVRTCEFRLIPTDYVGMDWSEIKLRDNIEMKSVFFERYIKTANSMINKFSEGGMPKSSVFIVAPEKFGKMILAYHCMQLAINNGLSVAPILDTVEAKRLLILGANDLKYRLYGKYTYDKYITSDVLFLTVSKTAYHSEALDTVSEIMNRRSRLNLPTFIISRFRLKDCAKGFVSAESFVDTTKCSNLKYPVIVEVI